MQTFDLHCEIKALGGSDEWKFEGVASTSDLDRQGDVVEPKGAEFTLPLPLLWQHDSSLPVGSITSATVTAKSIKVRGQLVKPDDSMPPSLQERLSLAWASLKSGLVKGLSIGFMPGEYALMENGGAHFKTWSWAETSLVTVPANGAAQVTAVKAAQTITPFVNPQALKDGAFHLRS